MKNAIFIAFLAAFAAATAFPAEVRAQAYNPAYEELVDMNRGKPLQNPDYEKSGKILARRVLDGKKKVVGEIRDVILNENGSISSLQVEFDRLRLGAPVFLNYRDMNIEPAGDGYAVRFTDDEIEEIYPGLLANIESASGDDDETFSVRKIIGAEVMNGSGLRLGQVEDVLFDAEGGRAEVLYVKMTQGTLQGRDHIAIPYGMGQFGNSFNGKTVTVNDEQAEALIRLATQK